MSKIALKFIWSEKFLGGCLDQQIDIDRFSPLTDYTFWPQKDFWEYSRNFLESNKWIKTKDAVYILNRIAEVTNFWEGNHTSDIKIKDIQSKFTDCIFLSSL